MSLACTEAVISMLDGWAVMQLVRSSLIAVCHPRDTCQAALLTAAALVWAINPALLGFRNKAGGFYAPTMEEAESMVQCKRDMTHRHQLADICIFNRNHSMGCQCTVMKSDTDAWYMGFLLWPVYTLTCMCTGTAVILHSQSFLQMNQNHQVWISPFILPFTLKALYLYNCCNKPRPLPHTYN